MDVQFLIGFGAASGIIVGLISYIFTRQDKRISKVENIVPVMNEIKTDVSIILSHTEGKMSFADGLVELKQSHAVTSQRIENIIDSLTELKEEHKQRMCSSWDGTTDRRKSER